MTNNTVDYPKRDRVLDPARSTILVVDAQMSEYNDEKRAEQPAYVKAIEERALPAIRKRLVGAPAKRVEIFYTMIESLAKNRRDRSLDHKLSDIHVPKGSPLAKMLPSIEPKEDDIVLPKTSFGVFNSTNVDYVLRNFGVENVIVVGFVTNKCVDMAVRDGADKGFYMVWASDGCATYSTERHEQAMSAFGGYCRLQTVDEVLAALA